MDVYSPDSPLGNAVIGKKQGDTSSFELPNGKEITIAIKKVETYQA
jgi:transcription elongation factor GreA